MQKLPELCNALQEKANRIYPKLDPFKDSPMELPQELRQYFRETEERFKDVEKELKDPEKGVAPSSSSKYERLCTFPRANKFEKELKSLLELCDLLDGKLLSLATCKMVTEGAGEVGEKVENVQVNVVEVREKVGEVQERVREVQEKVSGIRGKLGEVKENVGEIGDNVDQGLTELTEKVRQVDKDIKELTRKVTEAASDRTDNFEPIFNVPPNPASVTLKLEDPNSPEGMLKTMLLDPKSGVVAAVSTSAVAIGVGGVGRTCALRGAGHDQEVKQHFSDGVYWLAFGQDATDDRVIDLAAEVVKESGGIKLSNEIRAMADVSRAARKAGGWFAGRQCFFLCDDLWRKGSRRQGYFYVVKDLVDEDSGSRLLCSTRDREIAELVGIEYQVQFCGRPTEEARQIICRYSRGNGLLR